MLYVTGGAGRSKELAGLMCRSLMTAQADFVGDRFLEARHPDAADQGRVAQATLVGKEGMRGRQWPLAVNGLRLSAYASKPEQSNHGNGQTKK